MTFPRLNLHRLPCKAFNWLAIKSAHRHICDKLSYLLIQGSFILQSFVEANFI